MGVYYLTSIRMLKFFKNTITTENLSQIFQVMSFKFKNESDARSHEVNLKERKSVIV